MFDKKLIVNLAPTGIVPTKKETLHVPLSIDEIVSDVAQCVDLGVNMVHLHARNHDGESTSERRYYAQMNAELRSKYPDLVIVNTTSGRVSGGIDSRSAVLSLTGSEKPDMASLTLSSLNFPANASVNSPDTIVQLLKLMNENNIKPELEVFDLGMINYAHYLINHELLEPPYYFNIILGNVASAQASLLHLATMVSSLPDNSIWSLGGVGRHQQAMNHMAIATAYGLRVGIEDNIWFDLQRTRLASNKDLVARVISICESAGREIASLKEVRNNLGLDC